ncbi:GNAT family N-acetyltransferase [Cellulomonas sp. P5_C5]
MTAATRLLSVDDVEEVTSLLRENREFMAPWDPTRADEYYLVEKQLEIAEQNLEAHSQGTMLPLVVLDDTGAIAGRLNLNGITRGAFQSAALGYWVSKRANGRGLATRAVADVVALAFGELGLHRLQAETLFANAASRRVLSKNGFRLFGVAPSYLRIHGRWQDHMLFQLIADEPASDRSPAGSDSHASRSSRSPSAGGSTGRRVRPSP